MGGEEARAVRAGLLKLALRHAHSDLPAVVDLRRVRGNEPTVRQLARRGSRGGAESAHPGTEARVSLESSSRHSAGTQLGCRLAGAWAQARRAEGRGILVGLVLGSGHGG